MKTRLHNGAEFQLGNFNRLRACALELTTDDYVLKSLSAQLDSASSGEICLLGKQYVELDRRDDAVECQEEIRKRINDRIAARAYDDRSLRAMCKEHLTLAAATGDYSAERLVKSIRGLGSLGPSLFRHFLRELSRKNDVALLAALLPYPLPLGMRRDLERALIRLAGVCEAKLHEWPEFKRLKKHPIVACWALLYWRSNAVSIEYAGSVKGLDTEARDSAGNGALERHLHCLFFEALSKCLALGGARPQMTTPELKKRKWLNEAIAELIDAAASVGAILVRGDDVSFSHCYSLMSRLSVPNDFDSRTDYFAVKAALLEISTDVFCLTVLRTGLRQIGTRDWEMVTRSPHFTFEHWRDRYVANALHLLSASDVGELVASRERQEDNSISQFNERAELYVGLCELALTESLTDHAGRLLRKAVGCVMGYGWRKDMTVFHVLSAIEAVATRRPRVALAWLRSVCPAISEIDRITDGDETRHAKVEMAELLLSMAPSSYVAYHDFLLKSSEWYEAERTFAVLLEKEPLHTEIMHIPTDVLWGTYEVGAIRERAQAGDKYASAIIERNECRFGFREGELGKGRDRSGSSDASEAEEPQFNVEGYAPETLGRLLEDLRQEHVYVGETAVVRRWFNFWVSAGRGRDVLKAIEPFLDSESIPSGASELLDEAFEVSRRLQGKTVAYKWIVAAHVHRHGWSDFWSRESAIARLRVVAQHYPKNWKQFVLDTSTSPFRHVDEKLVIPHHRLVQLLVEIEELDAAVEVTNEMVSGFLLEVSEQPLTKPKWLLE